MLSATKHDSRERSFSCHEMLQAKYLTLLKYSQVQLCRSEKREKPIRYIGQHPVQVTRANREVYPTRDSWPSPSALAVRHQVSECQLRGGWPVIYKVKPIPAI